MARTRSPEFDSIKDDILEKTAQLFASRGFVASSIGDIAEACACSKSRLYHYFESKEAILSTMLTEHIGRLVEGGRAIIAAHPDPIERFRALIRFFTAIYSTSRSQHVVLLTCMEFLPEPKRREIIDQQRELVGFLRDILTALRPDRPVPPKLVAIDTMLFFGMINWTCTWYRADGDLTPDALADRCIDLFLNGHLQA